MKKYRLKKKFLVVFYILVMVSFIGAIFAVDVYLKEDNKKNPEIKYINKNVIDNDIENSSRPQIFHSNTLIFLRHYQIFL